MKEKSPRHEKHLFLVTVEEKIKHFISVCMQHERGETESLFDILYHPSDFIFSQKKRENFIWANDIISSRDFSASYEYEAPPAWNYNLYVQ